MSGTTYIEPDFGSYRNLQASMQDYRLRAEAQNMNGFMVRQDFMPIVGDYRRKETVLWQLIKKTYANAATIKEAMTTARPQVEFTDRSNLSTSVSNPVGALDKDLTDLGQDVKALAGRIDVDHFGRSLYEQQGKPYMEQVNQYSDELITQSLRKLEFALIDGNASAGNGYEFNGFTRQMASGHTSQATKIGVTPDLIHDKLDEIVMRASTDVNKLRRITHIFCSGPGYRQLQKEMKELQQYHNVTQIRPGVEVPAIITAYGLIPIIISPFIRDTLGDPLNNIPNKVNYWLMDMSLIEWHGVVPFGGDRSLEPQIFDINNTINGEPLLEKRFCLQYGTLYCKNQGEGIYKLEVSVDDQLWNV